MSTPRDEAVSPRRSRGPIVFLTIAAAIGAGVWVWEEFIENRVVPRNFAEVTPGELYRAGRQTPPTLTRIVRENEIRTIIDLGGYSPGSATERRMIETAESLGVHRFATRLKGDARGNPNAYVQVLELIADPANHPVLVHCAAGSERTGATVALHRHLRGGVPLPDALAEAITQKHDPADNPRMFSYVVEWADEIAESLRTGEPIAGFPSLEEDGASLVFERTTGAPGTGG
ncbi:MAG: tyrosine-protein phosphatase [Planctomycetota bacterium]